MACVQGNKPCKDGDVVIYIVKLQQMECVRGLPKMVWTCEKQEGIIN